MFDLLSTRRTHAAAFIAQPLPKGKAWADMHYSYDYETEDGMLYLVWYSDNPKLTITQKIADASAAYEARFGTPPNVALVSADDNAPASVGGVVTRAEKRVQRNTVHVGVEGA